MCMQGLETKCRVMWHLEVRHHIMLPILSWFLKGFLFSPCSYNTLHLKLSGHYMDVKPLVILDICDLLCLLIPEAAATPRMRRAADLHVQRHLIIKRLEFDAFLTMLFDCYDVGVWTTLKSNIATVRDFCFITLLLAALLRILQFCQVLYLM